MILKEVTIFSLGFEVRYLTSSWLHGKVRCSAPVSVAVECHPRPKRKLLWLSNQVQTVISCFPLQIYCTSHWFIIISFATRQF